MVVDFPFVPVIAIIFGRSPSGRAATSRAKISISQIIGTLAALAFVAVQCALGRLSGTPGDRTSPSQSFQSIRFKSIKLTPLFFAASRTDSLSSQAQTIAPPRASDRAAVIPVRPSPKTASVCPLNVLASIIELP